ncbi:granzyme K-like isoform X1 [Corvus cornix cornix]|uniref:granzyme K-like isoform X1 n=2 Tax=Corvus cornix cornix TaxID=932674 RepID=UPI00090086A3|nr:granzyme K-like isoform X1 [Corvus cornix cornix]
MKKAYRPGYKLASLAVKSPCYRRWNERWDFACLAHKLIDESEDRVVLGAHQASIAEKEQQIFEIMEIFHHHQFDWSSRKNDIMLLKLNDTAKLNQYVQCLPLPDSFEGVEPGTLCKVTGWGNTSSGKPPKYLQEGDSGGPLFCDDQYHGIVTFGKNCGKRVIPGVYTWLTEKYIVWIKKKISRGKSILINIVLCIRAGCCCFSVPPLKCTSQLYSFAVTNTAL